MRVYLREEPEVVLGKEDEYAEAIRTIVYPMLDVSPVLTLQPVGAFKVDPHYGSWPNFVLLWSYEDGFESYAKGRSGRTPGVAESAQPSHDPAMMDYVRNAGQWRQRFSERLMAPLDFSPQPAPRPAATSAGAILLEHTFAVVPGRGAEFVRDARAHMVPGANEQGLNLELFARSAGRPSEYTALWSLPSWEAWAVFQSSRNPDRESSFIAGYDRVVCHLTDVIERTLVPLSFSPLGGQPGEPPEVESTGVSASTR